MPRRDPNQPCVNTIAVANVDESLQRRSRRAAGCAWCPRWRFRESGWLAYCKDTEGHIFGIMHSDTTRRSGR